MGINGRGSWSLGPLIQQPWLCGLSARARSRLTLRKMLVKLSEHAFVALECQICAALALAKAQPAKSPLRMSSAFRNAGGTFEDTQGSFMTEMRLQRKIEWAELSAVLVEGLRRLHGAGVELAESVLLLGRYGHFHPTQAPLRDTRWWCGPLGSLFYMNPRVSGSAPLVDEATSACALDEGSAKFVNQTAISHLPKLPGERRFAIKIKPGTPCFSPTGKRYRRFVAPCSPQNRLFLLAVHRSPGSSFGACGGPEKGADNS